VTRRPPSKRGLSLDAFSRRTDIPRTPGTEKRAAAPSTRDSRAGWEAREPLPPKTVPLGKSGRPPSDGTETPIAVGTPAREEMEEGDPPDLSPPASRTRLLSAAVALLDQIPAQENPGSRNPRGCLVFTRAAVLPGGSRRSYDRSRRSRGRDRSSPRLSLSLSRRTWCSWCAWLPGRHRRHRRRSAIGVIAGVLRISRTSVFAAGTPELGPGVAVRMHVPVGVRVGARLRGSRGRPAHGCDQCGRKHKACDCLSHGDLHPLLFLPFLASPLPDLAKPGETDQSGKTPCPRRRSSRTGPALPCVSAMSPKLRAPLALDR